MTDQAYAVQLTRAVRRAFTEKLPVDVVTGAVEFINGPTRRQLAPRRQALDAPLDGVHSARLMREWRVVYVIDDHARTVTVRSVVHRRDAYRSPCG